MASDPVRLAVVVIAILALIVLITKFRVHPFIALILASWFLGIACGLPLTEVIKHFEKGFGDVLSFVGIVIGLGAMLGGILISSGGADVLANDLIALGGKKGIPWTMFWPPCSSGFLCFLRWVSFSWCRSLSSSQNEWRHPF